MARPGRFAFRLLLAAAVAAGCYLGWISALGSPAPLDVLPRGAAAAARLRGAADLAGRLAGTRLAAEFSDSATRAWLERSPAVQSLDALRAELGRLTGWTPGRRMVLDVVGQDAAVAWYAAAERAPADQPCWVAAGRLSLRAWAAAGAARLAHRAGLARLAGARVARETVASGTLFTLAREGRPLHLIFVGRTVVAATSRDLALKAAAAARGDGRLTGDVAWRRLRGALPEDGELLLWARGDAGAPWLGSAAHPAPQSAAAALLRFGRALEIDVAADAPSAPAPSAATTTPPASLPAIALLAKSPLLFFTSGEAPPQFVVDALLERQARARGRGASGRPPVRPGHGFALAITGSAADTGLLPAPRGVVVLGLPSAAEATAVLGSLYPPDARTATAGGAPALATRESFPLGGEYDLWGAALGRSLVFATDRALIDAVAAGPADSGAPGDADRSWRVRSLCVVDVEQALPLLRRWAVPLSGLLAARAPGAPDVAADVRLLAAVRTVRVAVGTDAGLLRAAATATLREPL